MKNTLYKVIDAPQFYDRYTLCFNGPNGPFLYSASENPYHPLGFGQYGGDRYVLDAPYGTEISRDELPEPVQRLVEYIEGE